MIDFGLGVQGAAFARGGRDRPDRVALILAASLSGPADAAGCLKGSVVGGVAGHYAGNYGLLGAGAGCLVGRHYAKKHARQEMNNNDTGYGSSRYNAGQNR